MEYQYSDPNLLPINHQKEQIKDTSNTKFYSFHLVCLGLQSATSSREQILKTRISSAMGEEICHH